MLHCCSWASLYLPNRYTVERKQLEMKKLSELMTIEDFENGYWYLTDLKLFAKGIGVDSISKLRKDELEEIIKTYLKTGKMVSINKNKKQANSIKDYEKGLKLKLPIVNYVNNKITKNFIITESKRIDKNIIEKSGVWYRLNRWRESKLENSLKITYEDLIKEYIRLNKTKEKFEKISHARYINFLSEYMKNEKSSTREEGIKAWHKLKLMNIAKTYKAWKEKDKI